MDENLDQSSESRVGSWYHGDTSQTPLNRIWMFHFGSEEQPHTNLAGDGLFDPTAFNVTSFFDPLNDTSSRYGSTMYHTDTAMTDPGPIPPSTVDTDVANQPVVKQEPIVSGFDQTPASSNMTGDTQEPDPLLDEFRNLLDKVQQKLGKPLESIKDPDRMFDHQYLQDLRSLPDHELALVNLDGLRDKLQAVDSVGQEIELVFGKKTETLKKYAEEQVRNILNSREKTTKQTNV
jgi:hypothetical protein